MNYSQEFLELLASVTAKRPKTVIDHILKHGFITTEELKETYGYNHPPRAVRDVREQGIPIVTYRVEGSDGRKIAAYKFGDFHKQSIKKKAGRTALSKKLKAQLLETHGSKCFIYNEFMPEQELQIDHRIPFEVAGDGEGTFNPDDFMLLSPSANREKDWACEHCPNWQTEKNKETCKKCYWAYPENYSHVATKEIRRVDIEWSGEDVPWYDQLVEMAKYVDKDIQTIINNPAPRGGILNPLANQRNDKGLQDYPMTTLLYIMQIATLVAIAGDAAAIPLRVKRLEKKCGACIVPLQRSKSKLFVTAMVVAPVLVLVLFLRRFDFYIHVVLCATAFLGVEIAVRERVLCERSGLYEDALIVDGRYLARDSVLAFPELDYENEGDDDGAGNSDKSNSGNEIDEVYARAMKVVTKESGEIYVGFASAEEKEGVVPHLRTWVKR